MYFSCKSTILLAIYTPVKCCNTCGLYCRSLLNFPVGWVEAEQCIAFYCYWVMASSAKKKIQDSELEKLKPFKRWVSMNNIFFSTQQKILTHVNFPMICGHASGKLFSMASKMLGLETCFISMGISICFLWTIIYKNCISGINGDEMILSCPCRYFYQKTLEKRGHFCRLTLEMLNGEKWQWCY